MGFQSPTTELFPEPAELRSRAGRDRILADVRAVLRAVGGGERPVWDEGWLVLPAPPQVVFAALQRADPGWPRRFELVPGDEAIEARARRSRRERARRRAATCVQ